MLDNRCEFQIMNHKIETIVITITGIILWKNYVWDIVLSQTCF